MSGKPSKLVNFGEDCYLNSGIQAISACCHFIYKINELSIKNTHLKKLQLFNNLIKSINESEILINISKNDIFKEWNKSGQQDSFELLNHVINEVFDEVRRDRGIARGSVNQYLVLDLPMRMKLEYEISCECGNKETSPIQLDLAFHLTLPHKKSFNGEQINIQKLLNNHFEKDEILEFRCGRKDCKISWRELKIYSPFPHTLCVHLQRLFWNGKHMEKNNVEVLFSNMITINENHFKKIHDRTEDDVHFFLKSAIVHYGQASFGHYICYKKYKGHWFHTNDTNIYPVNAQKVFSCNPYILFYEKENEVQMSPTIIKVDENLNFFINAISNSVVFINWLSKISADNDNIVIKRLIYLTNLANGNITRDEKFEKEDVVEWCHKGAVYDTMMDILSEIKCNVDIKKKEETAEINIDTFPLLYTMSNKEICLCSEVFVNKEYYAVAFNILLEEKYRNGQGTFSLQDMLDNFFVENRLTKSDFDCKKCLVKQSLKSVKFKHPLPGILCIHLHRWPGNIYDNKITFDNNIFIREAFLYDEKFPMDSKQYFLKSVIGTCNGRRCCFRNYNASWYQINKYNIEVTGPRQILECDECVLFYDSSPCKFIIEDQQYSNLNYLQMTLEPSIKAHLMTNNIIIQPKLIKVNVYLNIFIHAISSCVYFLDEIEYIDRDNLSEIIYLTNISNGKEENEIFQKGYIQNICCCNLESIDQLMKRVLEYISLNSNGNGCIITCSFVEVKFCNCGYKATSEEDSKLYISVSSTSSISDLETLINNKFMNNKTIKCEKCLKIKCFQSLKLCKPLRKTISIKVLSSTSKNITFTEIVTIKNESLVEVNKKSFTISETDETYELRSVITESGRCCYRKINDNWHEVKDKLIKLVSINEVLKCKPHFLFYESKDRITKNRLLSCILHSLSSCSTFIEWLDAVKTRREMIKGRYLFELIKIINGQYQGYRGEEILRRWNDSHCNDAYLLLKIILQDLEEEMDSTSGSDEVSQKCYLNNPMKLNIYKRECYTNNDIKTNLKSKLILNISLTEEDYHNEEMHTIQKMLDKYFNNKVCKVNEDNKYKCKVHVNNKQNVLIEPFPSIICIKINLFYEEDGKCMKFTNILKLSKKINILCSNTILYRKEYKLRSVIKVENFPSEIYYCFKETDNGWIFIKNESIVPSSEKEVLETESYIAFYEIVNSIETLKDSTFEDFRNNNTNNDQPIKYDEDLIESSSERSSFKYECICDLHSDEDFLNSLNPNLSDLKHNTISFGDIPFNERLNNFLQSILFCTKLIRNCKRFLNDSDSCSKYNSLFNKIHEVIESQTISLNVHEYEILTSLSQSAFLSDIECFAKIFSEILKPNDLVKDNCLQKWNIPFVIFNISEKFEVVESWPISRDIIFPRAPLNKVTIQQLCSQHLELYSNPFGGKFQSKFLIKGHFPDTICLNLSIMFTMSLTISKPFSLLMKNELCQRYDYEIFEKNNCYNASCCRKYKLKVIIDVNSKLYKVSNDQVYVVEETKSYLMDYVEVGNIIPRVLLYE